MCFASGISCIDFTRFHNFSRQSNQLFAEQVTTTPHRYLSFLTDFSVLLCASLGCRTQRHQQKKCLRRSFLFFSRVMYAHGLLANSGVKQKRILFILLCWRIVNWCYDASQKCIHLAFIPKGHI